MSYAAFLERKLQMGVEHGFAPIWEPDFLFPFQHALCEWAQKQGRGALFADCGLGKTPMQLVWAENVIRKTNRPVLILTPLAVAQQTLREAEKFGIEARRAFDQTSGAHIVVTNYEKLHRLRPEDFSGVVCDESSAIKAFDGKRRAEVTEFLRTVPYRLLCTATAAPNDYIELGTSSEALGVVERKHMLAQFFTHDGGNTSSWRLKGHARERSFWRWVCSWARACRTPSDLGFENNGFVLPNLTEREHILDVSTPSPGMLFPLPASNLSEEREERRRTIRERCEMAAELVADTHRPAVVWCHLNAEGDLLEKLIQDGRQVAGSHSDDEKEEAFEAFASGQLRVLVIKPKIGAFGLNWQHCSHIVTFASHSYEQYYQAVRRCWRFGQERPVVVDLVATERERGIKENLRRKAEAADRMFSALVVHMNEAQQIASIARYEQKTEVPTWL